MRKHVLVGIIAFGALFISAAVAFAGWEWNARFDVQGVDTRVRWTVVDGANANDYKAQIVLYVPQGVEAKLVSQMTDLETAKVRTSPKLKCVPSGAEVEATVRIVPRENSGGSLGSVSLVANGAIIDQATGSLQQEIVVKGVLNVVCGL